MSLAILRQRTEQLEQLQTPGLKVVLSVAEARAAIEEADRAIAAVDEQQGRVAALRGTIGRARRALEVPT